MKKSRVLIPALAMIAFSTAASIAGSVAWFTASRSATVTASSFSVVKTSANLECTVTRGIGTYIDENNDNAVTLTHEVGEEGHEVEVTNVLTDGSFDHINKYVRTPNADGTALDTTNGSIALASVSEQNMSRGSLEDGAGIYTAVTFNLSFKVTFGSIAGDYGLFLDNTETSNVGASRFECEDDELHTAKGFRMAFVGGTVGASYTGSSTNSKVLADLQETSYTQGTDTIIACRYVGGTTAADFAPATATQYNQNSVQDLMDKNYKTALPTSATARADALARPDCLGVFAYREGSEVTLNYTVVCWFEGTDPEIVNRDILEEYQTVTSTLRFEAIELAAE